MEEKQPIDTNFLKYLITLHNQNIVRQFTLVKIPLEVHKKLNSDKDQVVLMSIEDNLEIAQKYLCEECDDILKRLEDNNITENDVAYKYILITINDNDFYTTLDRLGETIIKNLGDIIVEKWVKENNDDFLKQIPLLFTSMTGICQHSPLELDQVLKHIKILSDNEQIKQYISEHGLTENDSYSNDIFRDFFFDDIKHISGNAEYLIVRLAYNKCNIHYVEAKSDYVVV